MNGWQGVSVDRQHRTWHHKLRIASPAASPLSGLALALSLLCGCGGSYSPPAGSNAPSATSSTGANAPAAAANSGAAAPAANSTASASAAPLELPPPVEAYPPVLWTVPAGGLPESPPIADVVDIGDLTGSGVGGSQYVYLFDGCRNRYLMPERFFESPQVGFVSTLMYGEFDPATGKPVGEPAKLGPEYVGEYGFDMSPGRHRQADVSPSGVLAILSVPTPQSASMLSVVPPKATAPRVLSDMPSNLRWFAWTAEKRLLILHDGKLQLWEGGQAPAREFGEKLELPIVMSPARNWVVAPVDKKYLEIYDTKTGEVRGRIGPEGKWKQLAISHDGQRLAAVRQAGPLPDNSSSPPQDRYDIHIWDLATGKPTVHMIGERLSYGPPVYWAGPSHVYYDQRVYDLDSCMPVVQLVLPQLGVAQDGGRGIHTSNITIPIGSPDGRRWWTGNLGQAFAAPIPLAPPGGKQAFDKTSAVKLEVAGIEPARQAPVRDALTKALTAAGHKIGDSPWILKASAKVEDSGFTIYNKQETFQPPSVRGELKLIAPDATEVATISFGGDFNERNTAYLVKTTTNDPLQPMTTIYEFNFRGQPPREAILHECWDKAIKMLQSIRSLPTVWEVNGKFQSIPIQISLQPPPGVPRSSGESAKN